MDNLNWTQDDFEKMGWHDCRIYGFAFERADSNLNSDLVLDIDYITKWVKPIPPEVSYSFCICPCTLILKKFLI